ncbi:unnamed protein product [Symbiodinium pilosum]|uniref:Uncharacterized protein n=1 Tax=Symbiodinium pilosum TaxID=2952 RepID=A0A812W2J6_SYMPI|nr:unnamed protein product [Symbiodinium pilosum]
MCAVRAYAYGYSYVGSYLAVSGVGCAWRRWNTFGQEKEDEEEDAAATANANLPTDPAAGMPPGAPGMPGPPPMPQG